MTIPDNNRGLIAAIGAYAYWGLVPLYWKLVTSIQADELLYSRLILTALTCLLLLPLRGTFPVFKAAWADPAMLKQRLFSAALLAGNWFSFMWAVNNDRVIESSLGYFLCPLVSVFLGRFILKEKLGSLQWLAVALAAGGVGLIISEAATVPIAGIAIAFTWSGYGFTKKRTSQGPLVGLCLETTLLTPVAIGLLIWMGTQDPLSLTRADGQSLLVLSIVGLVTVAPLLMFAYAAQRIRLSTMGMGQYIVPSAHFGLAIYYDEPVTRGLVAGFGLIWTGLILYSISAQRRKAVDGSATE